MAPRKLSDHTFCSVLIHIACFAITTLFAVVLSFGMFTVLSLNALPVSKQQHSQQNIGNEVPIKDTISTEAGSQKISIIADETHWRYIDLNNKTRIDRYPHLPTNTRGTLYDFVLRKSVGEQLANVPSDLRELIHNTRRFRYRVRCDDPFVDHVDIPWRCFLNPCSFDAAPEFRLKWNEKSGTLEEIQRCPTERMITREAAKYNSTEYLCECKEDYLENSLATKKNSQCIPIGYREVLDDVNQLLTLRVPCAPLPVSSREEADSGSNGSFVKRMIPYPCAEGENGLALRAMKFRFEEPVLNMEEDIKNFKFFQWNTEQG